MAFIDKKIEKIDALSYVWTETNIQELLESQYNRSSNYTASNIYVFKHDWESDFFIWNKRGYTTEIEIKISKSDFKNDFSKTEKHQIIKTGKFELSCKGQIYKEQAQLKEWNERRPNRFFYCVPENLIDVKDIPDYAGLLYVCIDSFGGKDNKRS